ncbi:MAG TPA: FAD-dependent oxidoreductase [Xanthomonadales bacterium]|nr:FAD-dependent oxidoreductase [Xanthomonadales bacterium]
MPNDETDVSEITAANFLRKSPTSQNAIVVGAGLSGLVAARQLQAHGSRVTVVEKARGPGGRMSTRRESVASFDHGAQYFTAHSTEFRKAVQDWQERGLVSPWQARIAVIDENGLRPGGENTERFIGIPGMSALCRDLAAELDAVRFDWKATRLQQTGEGWLVHSVQGEALQAQTLVLSIPPLQARELLPGHLFTNELAAVDMRPCWAVMAVLEQALLDSHDAAFINHGPLSWISSQSSRPAEDDASAAGKPHAWVLHASAEWSRQHLEADPDWVCSELLQAASSLPGAAANRVKWSKAHRWRYSQAEQPLQQGVLMLPANRLVLAGDWCNGSRVEGAYLSGLAAAEYCQQ